MDAEGTSDVSADQRGVPVDALHPGDVIAHYQIVRKIAEGGMGEVYLATDRELGREIALKVLPRELTQDSERVSRFRQEARAASALNHPHILTIYEIRDTTTGEGQTDGIHFIAMEYIDGGTLHSKIHQERLGPTKILKYMAQVADGLAKAHASNIIHRDLKPANIMVSRDGYAKIVDFGLAKLVEAVGVADDSVGKATIVRPPRSRVGTVIGTAGYMSPEQAEGKTDQVDHRSDIFAFGCILYEAVTHHCPFEGDSLIKSTYRLLYEEPAPVDEYNPDAPPELQRIIRRCLAKDPEERYQSIKDVSNDLLEVIDQQGSDTRPPRTSSARKAAWRLRSAVTSRLRVALASGVVVVLAAAIAAVVVWHIHAGSNTPPAEATRLYEAGTNALREGAVYQAAKLLERAVRADERFLLARARLTEALMELGYTDQAKDQALRLAALIRDSKNLSQIDDLYLRAITAAVARDFNRALAHYRRIVELTTGAERAYALVDLGLTWEQMNDVSKATEAYLEATRLNPESAAAFLRLGAAYGQQHKLKEASAALAKADALYEALGNVEGRAEVQYRLAVAANRTGRIAEARDRLQQALAIARAAGNEPLQIKCLLNLSSVYIEENNKAGGEQTASQAIELAQVAGLENLAVRGFVDLGNVYFIHGEYAQAESYYRRALAFAEKAKSAGNIARAVFSLGSLRMSQGRTDEGIPYVERALSFYGPAGYKYETGLCYLLLGRANRRHGQHDAALRMFRQVDELARRQGDADQQMRAREGIAGILLRQQRYPEALREYRDLIDTARQQKRDLTLVSYLDSLASILWHLGRYSEAHDALKEAFEIATRPVGGSKRAEAALHVTAASAALSERRFSEAAIEAEKVLLLKANAHTDVVITAKSILGASLTARGKLAEGKRLCGEAVTEALAEKDPALIVEISMAFAELLADTGDARRALDLASDVEERAKRTGQSDSEWRAAVVAGRSGQKLGQIERARSHCARATAVLAALRLGWEPTVYRSYLARPDVWRSHKQLEALARSLGFPPLDRPTPSHL